MNVFYLFYHGAVTHVKADWPTLEQHSWNEHLARELPVAQAVTHLNKPLARCGGMYLSGEANGLIAQLQKWLCTISPLIKSDIMCPRGRSRT